MSIIKKSGRQDILSAVIDFNYSDLVNGVEIPAIELPYDALIVGGFLTTLVAFNSATSDVVDIKAPNGFALATGVSVHTTGTTSIAIDGNYMPNIGDVTVKWTGVGGGTSAGKCRLVINYIVKDRCTANQG